MLDPRVHSVLTLSCTVVVKKGRADLSKHADFNSRFVSVCMTFRHEKVKTAYFSFASDFFGNGV